MAKKTAFDLFRGEIPGGIAGEQMMRERAKTGILGKLGQKEVSKSRLEVNEINDLLNYYAWSIWDMLATRITEGESGLIPRQEYETLAFVQQFLCYPELFEEITRKVGSDGLIEMGRTARLEIGTKINNVHYFCLVTAALLGRDLLIDYLKLLKRDGYLKEINTILQFSRRLLWGARGDGYTYCSQAGYRNCVLESSWIERFCRETESLDVGSHRETFRSFNASTELLSFLLHFDCRLGMSDTGPYDLGNGRLMIVRDHFLREDVYHWSDVCEELPYAVTLAFILDSEKMGMEEMRINDISTTFTRPRNYLPYITDAALYARQEWDTPVDEIVGLSYSEAKELTAQVQGATFKLYKKLARMSRRQLIINGLYVYHIDMILPFARPSGLYEKFCQDYDLWEIHPVVSEAYHRILNDRYYAEVFPNMVISGQVFHPIAPQNYW